MSGWWAAAFVVQWILVAVLAIVVVALARQIGVLQLRLAPLGALEVDDEGPPIGEAPSNLAVVGRYVLPSGIFDAILRTKPGSGGEIQLFGYIGVKV